MKKILLYSMLALGTGLFSCSQEDLMEQGGVPQAGQPVTVSVLLPGKLGMDAASRALPSIPEGHKLRCILYVSGKDESVVRQEKLVTGESSISFTFTPETDTYTCSFWADYVTGTDIDNNGNYDDLYYNTHELPNVTRSSSSLADGYSFFNNEACDAFTGHFSADALTSGTVMLKRPFARVDFKEKVSEASGNIAVTGYAVSEGMDISNGTVSTTTAAFLDYSGKAAGDGVWFYNYLFADGENTKLPESISMTVEHGAETTISTDKLVLRANTQYNLSLTANVGEVVPSPKVGDYFYTDGTWSTDYNGEKDIAGVVFAVKGDGTNSAIESDEVDNYSDIVGASDVLAWVLAAKDASTGSNVRFYSGSSTFSLPEGIGTGETDIKGYSNTALWLALGESDYNAASTAKFYNVTIQAEDVVTSGWYLPTLGHMIALGSVYANETTSLAVKKSLEALSPENGSIMSQGNYWTSTGGEKDEAQGAYRAGYTKGYYGGNGLRTGENLGQGSYVRSVLTIFTTTEQQ